jgi:hypothetical protein
VKFSVDPWDPTYGTALDLDLEPAAATVSVDLELSAAEWRPIPVPAGRPAPEVVLFVDGVRRVEARVWIDDAEGDASPGICASYAAGVVACDGAARVVDVDVQRGLFTAASGAMAIESRHGRFGVRMTASGAPDVLSLALQERMTNAEVAVAQRVRSASAVDDDLLVVDGPLRGRQHLPRTVGMVKTHNVTYLPTEQNRIVAALRPGERTPVFTIGTSWSRHSWYLCLPGGEDAPWAGVVRCEATSDLAAAEVVALADFTAIVLPRFASEPYKDARAPQNLYPIGGLERELRRRLGDSELLYRALRTVARRSNPDPNRSLAANHASA